MATIARVRFSEGTRSHTVIDATGLPIAAIEEYLAFLRADGWPRPSPSSTSTATS